MANEMTKLAKKIKGDGSTNYMGPLIGTVEKEFPNFVIRLDNNITLKKENKNTIFAYHILDTYKRITTLDLTSASGTDSDGDSQSSIGYSKGVLNFIDTIKKGDVLIVIPSADNQKYFVMDWAVEL